MNHVTALILMLVAAASPGLHAVEEHKAAFAGGTIASLNAEGRRIGGRIDTSDPDRFVFIADKPPLADMPLRVEYAAIHHLVSFQVLTRRAGVVPPGTWLEGYGPNRRWRRGRGHHELERI
jgi:hypothetical protein